MRKTSVFCFFSAFFFTLFTVSLVSGIPPKRIKNPACNSVKRAPVIAVEEATVSTANTSKGKEPSENTIETITADVPEEVLTRLCQMATQTTAAEEEANGERTHSVDENRNLMAQLVESIVRDTLEHLNNSLTTGETNQKHPLIHSDDSDFVVVSIPPTDNQAESEKQGFLRFSLLGLRSWFEPVRQLPKSIEEEKADSSIKPMGLDGSEGEEKEDEEKTNTASFWSFYGFDLPNLVADIVLGELGEQTGIPICGIVNFSTGRSSVFSLTWDLVKSNPMGILSVAGRYEPRISLFLQSFPGASVRVALWLHNHSNTPLGKGLKKLLTNYNSPGSTLLKSKGLSVAFLVIDRCCSPIAFIPVSYPLKLVLSPFL